MNDFSTARQAIGGLKGLMTKIGDAPEHEHKWKNMPKCPFCGAKGKAGVFSKSGVDFFKCHAPGCSSGNEVMTEIPYLAAREGLSTEKPATGGASPAYERFLKLAGCWEERPEKPRPTPSSPPPKAAEEEPTATAEDEQLIQDCIALVLSEQKASVSFLQRRLMLGYTRAARIMDELERRKIVGPAKGAEPRDILIEAESKPGLPNPVLPAETPVPDAVPSEPKTETPAPALPSVPPVAPVEGEASAPSAPEVPAEKKAPKAEEPTDEADKIEELPGRLALEKFYAQLVLSPVDERLLWEKRGLTSATVRALGFVSSPIENKAILEKLGDEFSADELLEAGLFLPEDKKRSKEFRPNSQFYGLGQKGKKPKEERKHREDRWVWGMVHPVIIPYFDEGGRVIKLRPHKGGAPGNTLSGLARLYVPRDFKKAPDMVETFPRVVITEGEFKAAGLWQVLGGGREDLEDIGHPWGCAAIPGINFGANYDLRSELDMWLQAVQCRQLVVAFDDEDKSGRPLRDRHEALIWARFLACDLARTLRIKAKVLVLPSAWRNEKGKADWDGALAGMLQGKIKI